MEINIEEFKNELRTAVEAGEIYLEVRTKFIKKLEGFTEEDVDFVESHEKKDNELRELTERSAEVSRKIYNI